MTIRPSEKKMVNRSGKPENKAVRGNEGVDYLWLTISLFLAAFVCAFILDQFLDWAADFKEEAVPPFDQAVNDFLHGRRTGVLTRIVVGITHFGDKWVYVPMILFAVVWLRTKGKDWKLVLPPVFILATTTLLNMGIKRLMQRPRPETSLRLVDVVENSLSYPSGHSMTAIAFYGFLIYLVFRHSTTPWKKIVTVVFLTLLILAVGTSRVYLGVHYATDVLAGFATGLIWLGMCIGTVELLAFRRRNRAKGFTQR